MLIGVATDNLNRGGAYLRFICICPKLAALIQAAA